MSSDDLWYKEEDTDVIWWKVTPDTIGEWIFNFDKKEEFNLFADYPHKLSPEQREIFDRENPHWAEFFKDRTE